MLVTLRSAFGLVLLVLLVLTASAAPPPEPAPARFELDRVSIQPGQERKLNQPIGLVFSEAIDFSTVNPNTVQLTTVGGVPAVGDFYLRSPEHLIFQPACPTEEDLSDSGLVAGEIYVLHVPNAAGGTPTVRSVTGLPLAKGVLVSFSTPSSTVLDDLFYDEVSGPPQILVQPGDLDGSWVSTGDGTETWFQLGGGGTATLPGYLLPLNLYSDAESRVTVHVRFDQSLLPVPSNIDDSRVRLEYQDPGGVWRPLVTKLSLVENCAGGGATLELEPQGVLPQRSQLRVWVSGELQDMVGDSNSVPLDHLRMRTTAVVDDAGSALPLGDERYEGFYASGEEDGSLEDTDYLETLPRAKWGGGSLKASTGFLGTGGPGGEFDYHVPTGVTVYLSTTYDVIYGGPDGLPVYVQEVIGGMLDLRDLYVAPGAAIYFEGPNPVTIHCSGTVDIEGELVVDGIGASPIFTLDQPQLPAPGAPGRAGGGTGGTGSYLTDQVTPRGGTGFGAFDVPDAGGEGGESGWHPSNADLGIRRRAAGGGGGRLGHDQLTALGCRDQSIHGLDVESGFVGHDEGSSSQGPHLPYGGHVGPSPFGATPDRADDFHGLAILGFEGSNPLVIEGELDTPWAGAGGGAGGDATWCDIYPPAGLIPNRNDKGAGGGGGAGSIAVYALGDITFGAAGKIRAVGGHGSGGENTLYVNRVGGGSGGGSGGHVILHTAGSLDLSQIPPGFQAIDARGGEGGVGADNKGGADHDEVPHAKLDARHVGWPTPPALNTSNVDNPWIPTLSQACIDVLVATWTNPTWVVRAAGGDGGPGLIQLHVPNVGGAAATHSIRYPGTGTEAELAEVIRPYPLGYDGLDGEWVDHFLPAIGKTSRNRSKWIALGEPQVAPGTSVPDPLEFLFGGVDPSTGEVLTAGNFVVPPPPLLSPGLPDVVGPTTIHFDATEFAAEEEIYARNPELLKAFRVIVGTREHVVSSAEMLPGDVLAITVFYTPPLLTAGLATLVPQYFGIRTGSADDYLPGANRIAMEFQAAAADANGAPDLSRIWPAPETWETDLTAFNGYAENPDLRFLRFRVTFELEAAMQHLRPKVQFLRIPYRF